MENHPGQNWKRNSTLACFSFCSFHFTDSVDSLEDRQKIFFANCRKMKPGVKVIPNPCFLHYLHSGKSGGVTLTQVTITKAIMFH